MVMYIVMDEELHVVPEDKEKVFMELDKIERYDIIEGDAEKHNIFDKLDDIENYQVFDSEED